MHRLHLPSAHSDADLVMAGQLAEALHSEDLYVVWSPRSGPYSRPEINAVVHDPVAPWVEACAQLVEWMSSLVEAVFRPRRSRGSVPAPAQPQSPISA